MFHDQLPKICEFELTTRCNALCPQCVRSFYGAKKWHTVPDVDLDIRIFQKILDDPVFQNIETVRLIGTYGDPILYPDLFTVVQRLRERNIKIIISTNGGIRTSKWWEKLAKILGPDDRVMFAIDGLKDTNHLYRVGVKFDKVINNLKTFNQAGGKSVWCFIVFKHNQHQIELAKSMSEEIGCSAFACKSTTRFIDKKHELIKKFPVLDKNQKHSHYLEPPDISSNFLNQNIDSFTEKIKKYGSYEQYLESVEIKCAAIDNKWIQITSQGFVFPCGWLYDRLYGVDVDGHQSQIELMQMIENTGGMEAISLHNRSLHDILDGDFFAAIKKSWQGKNRLRRCANQCGKESFSLTTSDQIQKVIQWKY